MNFCCKVKIGVRTINLGWALNVDPVMVVERASKNIEESREETFNTSTYASGSFSLGELLVCCRVAQVDGVGLSNVLCAFNDDRVKVLVRGEDDLIIGGLKQAKESSLVGHDIRLYTFLSELC